MTIKAVIEFIEAFGMETRVNGTKLTIHHPNATEWDTADGWVRFDSNGRVKKYSTKAGRYLDQLNF